MKQLFLRCYLIIFIALICEDGLCQMTLTKMIRLPFGKLFYNTVDSIRFPLADKAKVLKADFFNAYRVTAEDIQFDFYGNANFIAQYAKDTLVSAKVDFTFYSQDSMKLKRLLNTVSAEFHDNTSFKHLQEYGKLNVEQIMAYFRKNCVLTTPKTDKKYKPINTKFLDQSFWSIYENGQYFGRFIRIYVQLTEQHIDRNIFGSEKFTYDGGAVVVTIEITTEALQGLKQKEDDLDTIHYSSFEN